MSQEQFDKRYSLDPTRMDNPGLRKRSNFVVEQQKQTLAEIKQRPSNIEWFERVLDERGKSSDKPIIGFFCNLAPTEIVYAMGALPLRLCCGNSALVQSGEEVLHGEICPLVKSSFAEFLDETNQANRCSAIIMPTTCDPKRKLGEALSDYKPTFMLNLPPEQDFGRFSKMMTKELYRMAGFLGQQLGTKLKRKPLLNAIKIGQRRSYITRRLQELHAEKPAAICVRDAFVVMQSSFAAVELEEWIEQAEKVIAEIESYEPKRLRIRPRMILTGAPIVWPNFKLLNLIEESGADVVADTLCNGFQGCCDAVTYDETGRTALLRALASKYIFGSPCPCFISQATRISRVLELVDQYKADGVINYGLRLCQLFDIEVYRLGRVLKSKKIPFANIRTDYSIEDKEQLRVRLEAFLETVGEY